MTADIARCIAKIRAYTNCGKTAQVTEWQTRLIMALVDARLLPRPILKAASYDALTEE